MNIGAAIRKARRGGSPDGLSGTQEGGMTGAEILVWFASRWQSPKPLSRVVRALGPVQHDLDHLAQLGLLICRTDVMLQEKVYTLRKWSRYQVRRAA